MSKRSRQHTNPLSASNLVPREPLSLPDVETIELSLGCGDGAFVIARAQNHPDRYFIGLDIRQVFIDPGLAQIAELRLTNVRLETCNLIIDADHIFAEEAFSAIYINFPDPWFKRSHHARRWLTPDTLAPIVRSLRRGGSLIYQSDVWEPTIEAMGYFELHPELDNVLGEFTFSRELIVPEQTSREKACLKEGRKISRMHYRRVP